METRIEHVKMNNTPAGSARTEAHEEIIKRNAEEGFSYRGFVPTWVGPNGKILAIDLIFQK